MKILPLLLTPYADVITCRCRITLGRNYWSAWTFGWCYDKKGLSSPHKEIKERGFSQVCSTYEKPPLNPLCKQNVNVSLSSYLKTQSYQGLRGQITSSESPSMRLLVMNNSNRVVNWIFFFAYLVKNINSFSWIHSYLRFFCFHHIKNLLRHFNGRRLQTKYVHSLVKRSTTD